MAKINHELCTGCTICIPYCGVDAIKMDGDIAVIDQDLCTECYVCVRNDVCPVGAIEPAQLDTFIKKFQHTLSDPTETTAETGVPGRGTEEAKTNDVTGRFKKGEVGVCIDMGRPGIGCYLRDVEKVAMAVAAAGVKLEGADITPLAKIMTDLNTGKLRDEYLDIHMLSIIVEGKCKIEELPGVLDTLMQVEKEIDTVFSLGLAVRVDENGYSPVLDIVEKKGLKKPVRGKVNVGLGKPLVLD